MPPLFTLLLLTFLSTPASSDTLFVISGYISCISGSPFDYNMRVYEYDGMGEEDVLFTSGVKSSVNSHVFYNITTQDGLDHITNYYELWIRVLHNCNSVVFTKNAKLEFDLGSWPITHGTHYVTYNMDLTDKGVSYRKRLDEW